MMSVEVANSMDVTDLSFFLEVEGIDFVELSFLNWSDLYGI